ncbi:preprotein translocase subunit SecY [Candidatus Soleaferrea massiliensis]|uniref:preprotein translocase subunit SecY n=1 Tax=Candidatus Soleaferrea massiliensis TaxID=1470354 RepID=UPI0005911723|nr:preprotein translocase subunit SecY [Candidatus Soleaferrea massiliensis]
MFETIRNAWKIADLRKKLLYTLMIIIIFRIGAAIPVPFLDATVLQEFTQTQSGSLLGFIDLFSGGAFSHATIFAMSISPYITSSIVIQLLTVAIPALERMQKEGEEGRKRLQKITRYTTIILALIQATAFYFLLRNLGASTGSAGVDAVLYTDGLEGLFVAVIIIACFTAGTAFIVWLGDRISEKGLGNGISIILFAGILSRGPSAFMTLWQYIQLALQGDSKYFFLVPMVVLVFLALIVGIIIMTNAERRIPVQYAKRQVGRKMYGGQSSHIPIKVNMSGVMPVIFASSILALPGTIKAFLPIAQGGMADKILSIFNYNSMFYAILYFLLIIAFNYFYVAIQYNPMEIANNLRKNNGAVPGIRPGKPTTDFISKIINRITLVGALCLGVIAVLPIVLGAVSGIGIALGGTSIIIVVGVALDTMRSMESQMMMRHYKGFLE